VLIPSASRADEFAARTRVYLHWDRKLRGTTRFFGAAALTNAALVELCSLQCAQWWVGDPAVNLLSAVGRHLQGLNIEIAERIERGSLQLAGELDGSLVQLEQTVLERLLQHEAGQAPHRHWRAVQQINQLLSCVERWLWRSGRWPSAYLYRGVLQRVRAELGRQPDFTILGDRVGIGHALMRMLQ
jgi:hypothetical protein